MHLKRTDIKWLVPSFILLLISGCASEQYVPSSLNADRLTGAQLLDAARQADNGAKFAHVFRQSPILKMEAVNNTDIVMTILDKFDKPQNQVIKCHLQVQDAIHRGLVRGWGNPWWNLNAGSSNHYFSVYSSFGDPKLCYYTDNLTWDQSDYAQAVAFVDGLIALYDSQAGSYEAAIAQEEASFDMVATEYIAAHPKPVLPAVAQMYATQANDEVSRDDKDQAILLYQKTLDAAPWWPTGHYNLALLLGDKQDYDDAIAEMKKYLKLVPDAPDARKAQQQIWIWQGREQSGQ